MVLKVCKTYPAAGGPSKPGIGVDGFEAGPTEAGEYRIAYVGKHKSARYPEWSSVRWGTPLRNDNGTLEVKVNGK